MALNNSQYDTIFRDYQKIQSKNRHILDNRTQEVYDRIPEYRELAASVASISVEQGKKMLSGDEEALLSLKETLRELSLKKKSLLTSAGFSADYLEPVFDCPDCRDTGYINGAKCHCFKQSEIQLLYAESNIAQMLEQDNFSTLSYEYYQGEDLTRFQNAVDGAQKFVQDFNLDYRNLFFYGTVGTGKSFLSGCIARDLIESGHSVIYFSASRLFETLSKNTFDSKNKDELSRLYDDLFNCDLLIIDDLGTELTNSFVASSLFACLNERHVRKHATLISTNLSLEELSARYSERIFSRITSHFDLYKLSGQDIRMFKKRKANRK